MSLPLPDWLIEATQPVHLSAPDSPPVTKPAVVRRTEPCTIDNVPTDIAEITMEDGTVDLSLIPEHVRTRIGYERQQQLYDLLFFKVLRLVASGEQFGQVIKCDGRLNSAARYMTWIMKDSGRKALYVKAQQAGAEPLVSEMKAISDGTFYQAGGMPSDVARDKLRIDTRKWIVSKVLPDKYGDKTNISMTVNEVTDDAVKKLSISELKRLALEHQARIAPSGVTIDNESGEFDDE